jgi:Phycobilisome degradation protein nblA
MDARVFNLTLEQEFQMQLLASSASQLDREQMLNLLLQNLRLTMVKDNVIRELMKGCLI